MREKNWNKNTDKEGMPMPTEITQMDFSEVKLGTPLASVKRSEKKNDTLAVPESISNTMLRFFRRDNIEYTVKEPTLYEKLDEDIQRYASIDEIYGDMPYVLLTTSFDADALFKWSLQLFGEHMDSSYRAYLDCLDNYAKYYYYNLYEYRPDGDDDNTVTPADFR